MARVWVFEGLQALEEILPQGPWCNLCTGLLHRVGWLRKGQLGSLVPQLRALGIPRGGTSAPVGRGGALE